MDFYNIITDSNTGLAIIMVSDANIVNILIFNDMYVYFPKFKGNNLGQYSIEPRINY